MDLRETVNLTGASLLVAGATTLAWFYLVPVWDRIAASLLGGRAERLAALGVSESQTRDAMRLWGVTQLATPVVVWKATGSLPFAALAAAGVFVTPRLVAMATQNRIEKRLRDQVVTAAHGLADATRAGLNVSDGLARVAGATPEPLGRELRRIVADQDRGRPLTDALTAVQQRLDVAPFTLMAVSLRVAIDRGGRLHESLDRIGHSLRENQRLERKIRSETANGRYTAILLTSFPFGFAGVFHLMDPTATTVLFGTTPGQVVIAVVALLTYAGGRWAASLLKIDA